MPSLLSFNGKTRRLAYTLATTSVFLAQYVLVFVAFALRGQSLERNWRFYAMPLRSLVDLNGLPIFALPLAVGLTLIVTWALVALAFRRAADASVSGWIAAFTAAPVVQAGAILFLCLVPSRDPADAFQNSRAGALNWRAAIQGVLAGVGLTLFAVTVGALVYGTYGFGMFVIAPLMIGAISAFLANRQGDVGWRRTSGVVAVSLALGGAALIVGALEGIVCIVLASPLAFGAAMLGAAVGRAMAQSNAHSAGNSLMGIALLPIAFASERALPPNYSFSTNESIEVAVAPHDAWTAIVHMSAITAPLALPFKLGVAYPVRGDVVGAGIGATRVGTFSTGIALERVTEWETDRKLGFVVVSDPPAMRELSPYAHVDAPHVKGYFRTTYTRFEILPLAKGNCRILERTDHVLRLDPILYWMPFARWIIHENNMRVLTHIRDQAEHGGKGVGRRV